MVFLACGVGHAQDEHVLGQPALATGGAACSLFAHVGGDAQRKALLAQQRVATVARTIRPDFAGLGVVHDVFGAGVARPGGFVFFTSSQRRAHGVHAGHKLAIGAQHVKHSFAHAGHDLLVHHHVGAVAQLYADVADVRAQRAHRKRHHVQGATGHAAVKQGVQGGAHLRGFHPVVGGACVFFFGRADVGAVFHTGHVRRVGASQEGVGALGRIKLFEGARRDQFGAKAIVFFLGSVAPVNVGGLAQGGHFGDPGDQLGVFDVNGRVEVQALHCG